MGFNPPVPQQDSNWEIRVAVLLSLAFQIALIFVTPCRKRSSSPAIRFVVWSCYLVADWVADLALGLLLNNMGNIGGGGGGSSLSTTLGHILHKAGLKRGPSGSTTSDNGGNSPVIFAFWAPFLLLHLGGPDTVTAYAIEDNELWLRHLIGLFFELFSASVIFFCSLKGNPMIPATVLMFVVGIIKYGERTYSLYSGSVDGFRESIVGEPDPGPNYAKLMEEFDAKEKAGLKVEIVTIEVPQEQEEDYTEEDTSTSLEARAYKFFKTFRCLFVNLILSFKDREMSRKYFASKASCAEAFEVIEVELNFIYDRVYTKAPAIHTTAGHVLRFIGSSCIIVSILIFVFLDKTNIMRVDVYITFALLIGGAVLDTAALAMLLFSNWTMVFLEDEHNLTAGRFAWLAGAVRKVKQRWQPPRWSNTTSQLNLISYCLGKLDTDEGRSSRCLRPWALRLLAKVANTLRVRAIFDDFIFIHRNSLSGKDKEQGPILPFFFERLKEEAKQADTPDKIKEKCQLRGQEALKKLKKKEDNTGNGSGQDANEKKLKIDYAVIEESVVKRDFDESLLLWHIATDLCLNDDKDDSAVQTQRKEEAKKMKDISKCLSEYMLYLLINQPDMMAATGGIGLLRYRDTCAEARRFFESGGWEPDHNDARRMLLKVNTSMKPSSVKGDRSKSVLFDACILAKELKKHEEPELMWGVVAEVWREMLTYAAGKCRGSTHVRQLSRGGELITMVWFLMAHLGLGDMYQVHEEAKAKLVVLDQ